MQRPLPILATTCLLALCGCGKPGEQMPTAAPAAAPAQASDHSMAQLPATTADWANGAVRFEGLGEAHRAITTASPDAQQYFDQGLRLMWGFNHDEATRSFAKAAALDPGCAACFWGVALTVGPNYNLPFLSEERAKVAFEAAELAAQKAATASPVEQALIAALAHRYPSARPLDPASALPILAAYAAAMKDVAARFPQDLDVKTLYAESLMNLHAWKLWAADGTPAPGTQEIVATLEAVLAKDPGHAGANHYYVHALEASPHPDRALAAAERLKRLAPEAGHLVHMPAHIYQRIGRYEDAAEANRRAAVADAGYLARTRPPDYYPVMYSAHNYQFLAYSTAMEGRRAETIAAVDKSREIVSDAMLLEMPGADWYVAEYYTARVRFGLWDELLQLPAPNPKLPGLTAGYLYGRVVALAATGRAPEARTALEALRRFAATIPPGTGAGQNSLSDLLAIELLVGEARIAGAERRSQDAIALLRQAVAAEDRIAYDEPKNWFFPVRHVLGAALLAAGAAGEAEEVYRADLGQSPGNGWALFGLASALEAQRKAAEAARVRQAFAAAWKHADIALTASAL